MRRLMLVGSVVTLTLLNACARRSGTSAQAQFRSIAEQYIDSIARLTPEAGTALGDHRFDDRLSDVSAQGRATEEASDRKLLDALAKINRRDLTPDDQVDAALLENRLRYSLWQSQRLRSWASDVQIYNDLAGTALYNLAARDFAPWPQRLNSAASRMEAMPAFLAEARRQLVPARVPPIFAETVAKQNGGILEIANAMLAPHSDTLSPDDRARFNRALATLKAAVAEHQHWLDTVLVPQAKGDFRLGSGLYDEKMAFVLMTTLSRSELKMRAQAAVADTRREMYTLARQALKGSAGAPSMSDDPSPSPQQAAIEAALALSYAQRPKREELMQTAHADLDSATAFVRSHNLTAMPDAPVRIITMPKFQQGRSVAYDDPPGPLEKGGLNFFAVSPIPSEWSNAQATSFLSEYNRFMVNDLVIHEAMPGHYLQLFHSNKHASTLRAILSSGAFAEGWAVFAEKMMADEGYLDGDPLFKLTVLKMRLRSITNTLLDIGIQTEGMSHENAMALMTQTAFQQEREADGKWLRARLTSAQLLEYFTGFTEHFDLQKEARNRWGTQYTLRRYNDAVLSHGSPPVRFVRELMFNLPIQ